MPWNGGRPNTNGGNTDILSIINHLDDVIRAGFGGINLVFSNKHIDIRNPVGLSILSIIEELSAEVTCTVTLQNDDLYDLIRRRYPGIRIKSSILKSTSEMPGSRTSCYYNQLLDRFDEVVLHPDDNFNYSLIENLKGVDRLEVLINEKCSKDCGVRRQHYDAVDKITNAKEPEDLDRAKEKYGIFFSRACPKFQDKPKDYRDLVLSTVEVDLLRQKGVHRWKLDGRDIEKDDLLIRSLGPFLVRDLDILRKL
jgi:hypothetical protein